MIRKSEAGLLFHTSVWKGGSAFDSPVKGEE